MTPKEAIKTLEIAKAEVEWDYPLDYAVAMEMAITALGAIEQIMWERDMAISQLEEIGVSFGEKMDEVKEALEKQIPHKPINQSEEYDRTYGNCPCCGEMVVDYPDDFRVCSNCGQRLDWRVEE